MYFLALSHAPPPAVIEIAKNNESVLEMPEPRVRFRDFGDSALLLELLYWIDYPERRGLIQDHINTSIYKALAKAKIEIPFPKRDLYVREMPKPD